MKRTKAYNHFNTKYSVDDYSEMYKSLRLDIRYPANVKRFEIFASLLKNINQKK